MSVQRCIHQIIFSVHPQLDSHIYIQIKSSTRSPISLAIYNRSSKLLLNISRKKKWVTKVYRRVALLSIISFTFYTIWLWQFFFLQHLISYLKQFFFSTIFIFLYDSLLKFWFLANVIVDLLMCCLCSLFILDRLVEKMFIYSLHSLVKQHIRTWWNQTTFVDRTNTEIEIITN